MSAELAIAKQVNPYGMRLIKDENFDAENMIDVSIDVDSLNERPENSKIVLPCYTTLN